MRWIVKEEYKSKEPIADLLEFEAATYSVQTCYYNYSFYEMAHLSESGDATYSVPIFYYNYSCYTILILQLLANTITQ